MANPEGNVFYATDRDAPAGSEMRSRIGFIGAGRMAEAMIKGLIDEGVYTPDGISAAALSESTRDRMRETYGIRMHGRAAEAAAEADVIVLAVKPAQVRGLFEEEHLVLEPRHLLVSIVAGIDIRTLETYVPGSRVARVMPNHCCMVTACASGYAMGAGTTEDDAATVEGIFSPLGLSKRVEEDALDAVTGVSGSSPAFMYMMLDAIAEAGAGFGLAREDALQLAAQSMVGAGKMVLESGMTPEQLVDGVCSPGGTTIEGVKLLREKGFGQTVAEAVTASVRRSIEMKRVG